MTDTNINELDSVKTKLVALHNDAKKDFMRIGKGVVKSIFQPMQPADFKHAYLPVSKEQGEAMRQIIIESNCKNVVEFGTSLGISTIYLADAVRKTGGKVVTTELIESKAQTAIQNIEDAGLNQYVKVKTGDAMETLSEYSEPIDFLFLDGWKDLYLPLFKMLEPCFHKDTLVYADNMDMAGTKDYANYVQSKRSVYSTQSIHYGKAFLSKLL